MKTLGFLLLLLGVAVTATLGTADANNQGSNATAICHRTASKTNALRQASAFPGSACRAATATRTPADIIPAPRGACPQVVADRRPAGGRAFAVA